MESNLIYEVHPKEKIYFIIKIISAVCGYYLLFSLVKLMFTTGNAAGFVPMLVYIVLILLYLFFRLGILTGYLKGNAVLVSKNQFPQIYQFVIEQSASLGLKEVPSVYLLQNGGILNAFATRFFGSDYVIIYSDVLEEAFEDNLESVRFIIGHELGHIKRNHMIKNIWLFPSFFIPFLNSAYSRACEYTCDNIGAALSPKGARSGLMLLAAGKKLWKEVDTEAFLDQERYSNGFWFWFSEKVSTHPRLTKRIRRLHPSAEANSEIQYVEMITVPV